MTLRHRQISGQWRQKIYFPYREGFTLIELLFTITIISLLVAILMPALSLSKQAARGVFCQSNMKQVTAVLTAFAADHDGQLPRNRIGAGDNAHTTWRSFVVQQRYLPGDDRALGELVGDPARAGGQGATGSTTPDSVWLCPNNEHPPLREHLDGTSTCVGDVAAQYAYNGEIAWEAYPLKGRSPEGSRLVRIQRPSDTLILLETRAWWPDLRLRSLLGRGAYPGAEDDGGGYFSFWHPNATGNWGMYDGSVVQHHILNVLVPHLWGTSTGPNMASADDLQHWLADRYH